MNNYQGNLSLGPSVVTSLHMADVDEVLSWNTAADAMRASFSFASRKRDRYPETISAISGTPKGTISGLAGGSDKALATHMKRPTLMAGFGCMFLHQWEANQLGCVSVRIVDHIAMTKKVEELERQVAAFKSQGYTSNSPVEKQASHVSSVDFGSFTISGGS